MTASCVPNDWIHITLGAVVRVSSGMGFPHKYQGKQEGIYPVYKVGDISNAVINHKGKAFLAGNYVGELEAKELKGEVFSEGTTLFAKIGEAIKLNRRAFVTRAGLADNNVMAVIPEKLISKRFIHYFMRTVDLTDASRSTTVPSIRKGDIECLPLNIPSQAEQKEIADRLDKLLAQVEATQARLARIPDIIKRFRQSILAAAVSGKLTEDWRGTSSIDISHPSMSIGSESELAPKGWKWEKLTRLAILESGHTPRKSVSEYWENGNVYWLSLQDIREANGTIIKNTKFKPTMKGIENSSARLLPEGTVCFCRDISVGYVTIMGKEMSTTQHFANWICGDELNNKFLMYSFMAAKDHLLNSGQGTTVKTIYMPALKDLRILLPKVEEQTEIVRRVEQLFAFTDNLEQQAKAAKVRVDNLTQAILVKAFRGELTADWRAANPDLISGENSAATLLARIQTERAANGGKKKKRTLKQ
ncbi:hypothetical protein BJP22_06300 [Aeromonas veronii]|uniref:restriction endonuclease subunit S n=1 Tax=Aeromonas veronii TaxID=654 RepID=UPI00093CE076|nr:restriction endonuclease subunit S [Aeromonas veronii]OKP41425.1 hypothetical protein BJP22_06300 [Aeromonas veronii]